MTPPAGALLLTPGASATREHSQLVAVGDAASALGWVVERMDFPNPRAKPAKIVDDVRAGAARLAERADVAPERIVLGGRSFGGRMCSMAVAEGLPAAGLALVSYPLHPPGKPDRVRTDHFGSLDVACLFVSGTRDAFASVDELEGATATIPGEVTHVWLDGGDHGLRRRDDEVAAAIAGWLEAA